MNKPWPVFILLLSAAVSLFFFFYFSVSKAGELEDQIKRGKECLIVLGKSKIVVPYQALVGTQVDRVIRDIAWKDSPFDERVDPERVPTKAELVPYMEGYLAGLLMDYAHAKVIGLGPAFAVKKNDLFYAEEARGNFIFAIDQSKTEYGSAELYEGGRKAKFVDTHGFNMIAAAAMHKKEQKGLDLAIACLDLPDKAKAALYLAKNGIHCFGPCDRFAYLLLAYKAQNPQAATIIGTAPIRPAGKTAIIGDQTLTIRSSELIVSQYTEKLYPDQYCDTPTRYFEALSQVYGLKLNLIREEAGAGEADKVVQRAIREKAKVIGVRVWNEADADAVAKWLESDGGNRAILFHSAIYEPGYQMFFRFPKQTSFGDLMPEISNVEESR